MRTTFARFSSTYTSGTTCNHQLNGQRSAHGLTNSTRCTECVFGTNVTLARHRRIELAICTLLESILIMAAMTMFLFLLRRLFLVVRGRVGVRIWMLLVTLLVSGGSRVIRLFGRECGRGRAAASWDAQISPADQVRLRLKYSRCNYVVGPGTCAAYGEPTPGDSDLERKRKRQHTPSSVVSCCSRAGGW